MIGSRYKCQYVQQHATPSAFTTSESWVILSPIEQSIKRKIEAVGKPLKDWDIQIYRGVLTGCNEAFIIDEAKRAEILSNCQSDDERKRTEAIIRPILRGRDIRRYGYDWAGLYIVYIPWHFPLHLDPTITGASEKAEEAFKTSYPSVYNHLEGYKDILKKRNQAETGIRYEWYALQRWGANYWEEFEKPKIVWGNLNLKGAYTHAPAGIYVNAPCPIIATENLAILHILNSNVANYYIRSLGVTRSGGYFEYKPMFVGKLPIPLSIDYLQAFPETPSEDQERMLQIMIYDIYNLSVEERLYLETLKY